MKKVVMLFSAVVLFAGLTFGQTPQAQDKAAKPAEKKECPKDTKAGCDQKTKEACGHSKDAKSCCSKDAKKATPAPTTPEKK
ncbi:MAG: hypothetical protein WCI71_10035 [Bacteroidota bacterium]